MMRSKHWKYLPLAAFLLTDLAHAQSTERVSVATGGAQANGMSTYPCISGDGRFVAFTSYASNLVSGDTNGYSDIFVRDRQNGTTERVSVSTAGVEANYFNDHASISADGRFVAYESDASNLIAGDTNGWWDIFVRDRLNGTTERVSIDSSGAQSNGDSHQPFISADGRFVAFWSYATNLVPGDTSSIWDVFVHDRQTGTTDRVSISTAGVAGNSDSQAPSISADGNLAVFQSSASNLVTGDTNYSDDIFVRDRQAGTTVRASVNFAGLQTNHPSTQCALSADGGFVTFMSVASHFVPGDSNGAADIFVRDMQSGVIVRASVSSVGAQSDGNSQAPSISADGRFVSFFSDATNLVPGDTNGRRDVFVHDLLSEATERMSVSSSGVQANDISQSSSVSDDGRFVAFDSFASNLVAGDTNGTADIFVRDRGAPLPLAFCFGDGSAGTCPCGNNGSAGHGCGNSATTGGARLTASGIASLAGDTLVFTSSGELSTSSTIFMQGTASIAPLNFGDGLRCTGGNLLRLYVHSASGGAVSAPQSGDSSISARASALGDVLAVGSMRYHQAYYRDPSAAFCPSPAGDLWNVSSGLVVVWTQ